MLNVEDIQDQVYERCRALYYRASAESIREGLAWYPKAIEDMYARMGSDTHFGQNAFIVAVCAMNNHWGRTLDRAARVKEGDGQRLLSKVQRDILSGCRTLPLYCKTLEFFRALCGFPNSVPLDRHMLAMFRWKRSSSERINLARILAFRRAARRLYVEPRELQAILWVEWRKGESK